jgi:hypothetical protein
MFSPRWQTTPLPRAQLLVRPRYSSVTFATVAEPSQSPVLAAGSMVKVFDAVFDVPAVLVTFSVTVCEPAVNVRDGLLSVTVVPSNVQVALSHDRRLLAPRVPVNLTLWPALQFAPPLLQPVPEKVKLTFWPGAVQTGGGGGGGSPPPMSTFSVMLVPVAALAFFTVTFTLYDFLAEKLCLTVVPVAVVPSLKSHVIVSQSWIV